MDDAIRNDSLKVAGTFATLVTYNTEKRFPRARSIGVRKITPEGLIFHSDPTSPKMKELKDHPQSTLFMRWAYKDHVQQVEIFGRVEHLSSVYTRTKPTGSMAEPAHNILSDAYIFIPEEVTLSELRFYDRSEKSIVATLNYINYKKEYGSWIVEERTPSFGIREFNE